jgi:ComF family protein
LNAHGLCGLCSAGLIRFDAAYSYGAHDGNLRTLLHLFKYHRMRPLAAPLGRLMARALPRDERVDAIVPMPLHWRRWITRGYNQSELLAREVSARAGLPVERLLSRSRNTPVQAGLTSRERRLNVRNSFAVPDPARVGGRCLLLIDDVLTTGATLNAASGALKQAGAARIAILTLARADRRNPYPSRGVTAE